MVISKPKFILFEKITHYYTTLIFVSFVKYHQKNISLKNFINFLYLYVVFSQLMHKLLDDKVHHCHRYLIKCASIQSILAGYH